MAVNIAVFLFDTFLVGRKGGGASGIRSLNDGIESRCTFTVGFNGEVESDECPTFNIRRLTCQSRQLSRPQGGGDKMMRY